MHSTNGSFPDQNCCSTALPRGNFHCEKHFYFWKVCASRLIGVVVVVHSSPIWINGAHRWSDVLLNESKTSIQPLDSTMTDEKVKISLPNCQGKFLIETKQQQQGAPSCCC